MGKEAIDLDHRFDPVDRETWREGVERTLADGAGVDSLATQVDGALSVRPLYDEDDSPTRAVGRPGAPPFVRGAVSEPGWRLVHGVRGRDLEELVASARGAREGAADAVLFGPSACALLDAEALAVLEGPIVLDPGADALAWLGALHGRDGAELRFDPIGALAREGQLPYGEGRAWRILAELAGASRRIWIDATVHHEAGASAQDEVGLALATGVEYLRALSERGHPLADAPRRLGFALSCDADVALSIAKLRAARLAWSKVLRTIGIDGDAHGMHVHAFVSERARTDLEPLVGVLRGTAAAFAAIVGGAQDITLVPHVAGLGAERLARNTQHLLRHESHLDRVVDPAGGSHYIEALTESVARSAWATLRSVEGQGGMLAALRSGAVQERSATGAAARAQRLGTRSSTRVGVNRFAAADDPAPSQNHVPPSPPRSDERAPKALRDLFRASARGALAEAVEASDVSVAILRHELARDDAVLSCDALIPVRDAAPFEVLRRRAAELSDTRREALVLGVGPVAKVKRGVAFAREALMVAGLRAAAHDVAPSMPELDTAPATVAVCTDEPLAPIVTALRELGVTQVLGVGPEVADAGVDAWLSEGMDTLEALTDVLQRLEAV